MTIPEQTAEAQKPHTLFVKPDCQYCQLFLTQLSNTDLERMISVVDVVKTPVDPRQVHAVPSIVVERQTLYVGRDAFAWLLQELKRSLLPAMCAYTSGATPAALDGSDVCAPQLADRNFGEPEMRPTMASSDNEPIEARLARLKQDRG